MLRLLHAMAISACWFNNLTIVIKCLLTLGLLISAVAHDSHCQKSTGQRFLRQRSPQEWQISDDGERFRPIMVTPDTFLSFWLILLHFRDQQRQQIWPIFHDTVSKQEFRRLIVHLTIDHHPHP